MHQASILIDIIGKTNHKYLTALVIYRLFTSNTDDGLDNLKEILGMGEDEDIFENAANGPINIGEKIKLIK